MPWRPVFRPGGRPRRIDVLRRVCREAPRLQNLFAWRRRLPNRPPPVQLMTARQSELK
jgi:hypothetical protein